MNKKLFLHFQSPIAEAAVKHELPEAEPQVAPEPAIDKPVDLEQVEPDHDLDFNNTKGRGRVKRNVSSEPEDQVRGFRSRRKIEAEKFIEPEEVVDPTASNSVVESEPPKIDNEDEKIEQVIFFSSKWILFL